MSAYLAYLYSRAPGPSGEEEDDGLESLLATPEEREVTLQKSSEVKRVRPEVPTKPTPQKVEIVNDLYSLGIGSPTKQDDLDMISYPEAEIKQIAGLMNPSKPEDAYLQALAERVKLDYAEITPGDETKILTAAINKLGGTNDFKGALRTQLAGLPAKREQLYKEIESIEVLGFTQDLNKFKVDNLSVDDLERYKKELAFDKWYRELLNKVFGSTKGMHKPFTANEQKDIKEKKLRWKNLKPNQKARVLLQLRGLLYPDDPDDSEGEKPTWSESVKEADKKELFKSWKSPIDNAPPPEFKYDPDSVEIPGAEEDVKSLKYAREDFSNFVNTQKKKRIEDAVEIRTGEIRERFESLLRASKLLRMSVDVLGNGVKPKQSTKRARKHVSELEDSYKLAKDSPIEEGDDAAEKWVPVADAIVAKLKYTEEGIRDAAYEHFAPDPGMAYLRGFIDIFSAYSADDNSTEKNPLPKGYVTPEEIKEYTEKTEKLDNGTFKDELLAQIGKLEARRTEALDAAISVEDKMEYRKWRRQITAAVAANDSASDGDDEGVAATPAAANPEVDLEALFKRIRELEGEVGDHVHHAIGVPQLSFTTEKMKEAQNIFDKLSGLSGQAGDAMREESHIESSAEESEMESEEETEAI